MPPDALSSVRPLHLSRRGVLQVGGSGLLGMGLTDLLTRRAQAANSSTAESRTRSPKSMLVVFLTGACSHHDTFDMKPDAPAEVRGEFKSIATKTTGYSICEHLPLLAARSDLYSIVRSFSHGDNNHLMSTHHVLTGAFQPGAFFDKVASRDDWPCYSSGLAFLRPRQDGLPSGVNLPTFLREAPLTWPGQHAGFLGPKFDPWQITGDPARADFKVDSLSLLDGLSVERLSQRRSLLQDLNQQQARIDQAGASLRLSNDQQLAFQMLTSSRLASAFNLAQEPDATRDKYGRHTYGQSLLLARRLIQAGVPIVQANMGHVQSWDHHGAIFTTLKGRMLPPLDQAVSALLDDLHASGLLDETLVVMIGEFGRTPKINPQAGRDHWGPCFSGLFAGAGVRGGQVIGRSDEIGAYPVTVKYSPDDLGATVYRNLGISSEAEVHDRQGRPAMLNRGQVIQPLYDGTEA